MLKIFVGRRPTKAFQHKNFTT